MIIFPAALRILADDLASELDKLHQPSRASDTVRKDEVMRRLFLRIALA